MRDSIAWVREEVDLIPPDQRRRLVPCYGAGIHIERGGRTLINLTTNNYLSLATHPAVLEGAVCAVREDGAGAGSSRLIAGTTPRMVRLEERLAALKSTERALVTTSGFTAALAGIMALAGKEDGIALERGAHACLVSGARLSGAGLAVFRRQDPDSLDRALARLERTARRLLVVIDGVHSMDGDIAPLPDLLPVIDRHGALLFLDDAHATGVIGPHGEGTFAHFGLKPPEYAVQMGTLSKALGGQGGFIAAAGAVTELMLHRGASFIYTTALCPAAVGAGLAALDVLEREPSRLARLRTNALELRAAVGLPAEPSPILPIVVGESAAALEASALLEAAGGFALAIRPPTVPRGTARVRVSVQADHDLADPGFGSIVAALREIRERAERRDEGELT